MQQEPKRIKTADGTVAVVADDAAAVEGPAFPTGTVVVSFRSMDGEEAGAQVDLPLDSTPQQLEQIVNELLDNEDKVPYAFYMSQAKDAEVMGTLREMVDEHKISTETTLQVMYHPLSLFKVHPVTRCTDSMSGHTEAVLHVTFSPDGKNLGSGGGDTTVRFWDVDTCMPKHVCRGHKHHVLCTAWSPDGKKFVSGDKKGEIRVWDPATGKQIGRPLVGHRQWITSIAFEPLHKNKACDRIVTSSKDRTCRVWNLRTGRTEFTFTGHQDSVEMVKWGGEGFVYTGSRDRTIMVWGAQPVGAPARFKLVRVLKGHAHRINSLALSTDYLCRTGAFDPEAEMMKEREVKKNNALGITNPIVVEKEVSAETLYQRACERYAAAKLKAGDTSSVVMEEAPIDETKIDGGHAKDASGPIPFERLVSCSDDFTLFMWYPTQHKRSVVRMLGHQQGVAHINFSPDGRYLASASFDRKVKLWDGRMGRFVATLTGHVGAVYQVSWAPDSRMLASASKDSTVKVWAVASTKKAKYTLSGHADEVYALDWSPEGDMVASGSKDRLVKVWKN